MILIPIAIALFCIFIQRLFKKDWKGSMLYLSLSLCTFLVYTLWWQGGLIKYQKTRISELAKKNEALSIEIEKKKIEHQNAGD